MDATFWSGIAIGAVLSLIASIVANLLNAKIQRAFGDSQNLISSRRFKIIRSNFQLITKLKNGERDRLAFYIVSATLSNAALQISSVALATAVCIGNKYTRKFMESIFNFSLSDLYWVITVSLLTIGSFALSIFGMGNLQKLAVVAHRLDKYEEYKKEMLDQYPDIT